jgi:hypothetical protein
MTRVMPANAATPAPPAAAIKLSTLTPEYRQGNFDEASRPATRIINMAYEKMRSGDVDRMRGASINPPRSVSCTAALDMAVRSGRARLTPHSAPTPTGIATPAAAKTTRHIGSNGADMSVARFDQPPRTPPSPPNGCGDHYSQALAIDSSSAVPVTTTVGKWHCGSADVILYDSARHWNCTVLLALVYIYREISTVVQRWRPWRWRRRWPRWG